MLNIDEMNELYSNEQLNLKGKKCKLKRSFSVNAKKYSERYILFTDAVLNLVQFR